MTARNEAPKSPVKGCFGKVESFIEHTSAITKTLPVLAVGSMSHWTPELGVLAVIPTIAALENRIEKTIPSQVVTSFALGLAAAYSMYSHDNALAAVEFGLAATELINLGIVKGLKHVAVGYHEQAQKHTLYGAINPPKKKK